MRKKVLHVGEKENATCGREIKYTRVRKKMLHVGEKENARE
jgi:hypothetical protein